MLSHFNLNQFNLMSNHNNVTLNLILSNARVSVTNNPNPLLSIDKRHPHLNISLD